MIKTNNEKIVRRHIHAFLIQTYFLGFSGSLSGALGSALGQARSFFSSAKDLPTFSAFKDWVKTEVLTGQAPLVKTITSWLPPGVAAEPGKWTKEVAQAFLVDLEESGKAIATALSPTQSEQKNQPAEAVDDESNLLDHLFDCGLLPTYAFPTDLCSFSVERYVDRQVEVVERPQQSIAKALSEYAPGRLVVIDKKTYRCEAVTANTSAFEEHRARPLFGNSLKRYIFCANTACSFVQQARDMEEQPGRPCPLCLAELKIGEILRPEVFLPNKGQALDELDTDQEYTFASPAQFPIPLQNDQAAKWDRIGKACEKAFSDNSRLIVMNKGHPDRLDGFEVCQSCGITKLFDGEPWRAHARMYDVSARKGVHIGSQCTGQSRQVYLGNEFMSDLMIMRIHAASPLEVSPKPGIAAFAAFQSAMRTLAEALALAASRRLDLDPSEFTSGFRIVPTQASDTLIGEVYLFDTLSGGAGYSNQIGEELVDVLNKDVRELLSGCSCDRACYECLQHYGNQFYHGQLDRFLALALLDYAMIGKLPAQDNWSEQAKILRPLARMLSLSGLEVKMRSVAEGNQVPMTVVGRNGLLAVGTAHGLVANNAHTDHPLGKLLPKGTANYLANEYLLTRNMPAVHRKILELVGTPSGEQESANEQAPSIVRKIPSNVSFELSDSPRGMPPGFRPRFKRVKEGTEPSLRKVYLVEAPDGEFLVGRIQVLRRGNNSTVYRFSPAAVQDNVDSFETELRRIVAELTT